MNKIVKGVDYPDVSTWTLQLGVVEKILSQWPEWQDTIHWIIPHMEAGIEILMVFYKWQTFVKSYTNDRDDVPVVQTIPWGHATNMESGLQIKLSILVAFDPKPPLTNQAAPTIGVHHSTVVSMASWLTPRLTTATTSKLQNKQSYIAEKEHRTIIARLLFMELPVPGNATWPSAQVAQPRNIRPVFSMMWFMDMHTDG